MSSEPQRKASNFKLYQKISLVYLVAALLFGGGNAPYCPFYNLTGLPCPGCGMTRSIHSLILFHFPDSFLFHPLGILLLPVLLFFIASMFLPPLRRFYFRHSAALSRIFALGMVLVLFVGFFRIYWLVRSPEEAHRYMHDFKEAGLWQRGARLLKPHLSPELRTFLSLPSLRDYLTGIHRREHGGEQSNL